MNWIKIPDIQLDGIAAAAMQATVPTVLHSPNPEFCCIPDKKKGNKEHKKLTNLTWKDSQLIYMSKDIFWGRCHIVFHPKALPNWKCLHCLCWNSLSYCVYWT